MLPQTRSARRAVAGLGLALATLGSGFAVRKVVPPYEVTAPAYRHKGPAEAPVVIAEFSDFQCPACRVALEPLRAIQAMFPGKVRVVFKHRPWPFHEHAEEAALAAECAGKAGKFWEYHDALYARQDAWSAPEKAAGESFAAYARELGLDPESFAACLSSPEAKAALDSDKAEAQERWINSTPTFFINGERFAGAQQLRSVGLNRVEDIVRGRR